MRHRSPKMEATYQERRPIVAEVLNSAGGGVVCSGCHQAPAVDPHEIIPRGRGGSIVDAEIIAPLCRLCHDWVDAHPVEAEELGLLARSGAARHEFEPDEIGFLCRLVGCRQDRTSWRHRP